MGVPTSPTPRKSAATTPPKPQSGADSAARRLAQAAAVEWNGSVIGTEGGSTARLHAGVALMVGEGPGETFRAHCRLLGKGMTSSTGHATLAGAQDAAIRLGVAQAARWWADLMALDGARELIPADLRATGDLISAPAGAKPIDGHTPFWACVELLGFRVFHGLVSEVELFGGKMLHIEQPNADGSMSDQGYYGAGAIYSVLPMPEALIRRRFGDPKALAAATADEVPPPNGDDLDDDIPF